MNPVWLAVAAAILFALYRKRHHLEPTLLVGGVLVAAGCVVYATGVVHLPKIDQVLKDIGSTLGAWTYLLVGVMAFLETGAFVGLLAPGETVILIGGVVAGQGEIDIIALIAIVWACAVAGDMTSFLVGRRLGRDFLVRHGPKVQITEPRLEQTEAFFARHGGKAIFLGRFVGLIRAVAPFLAGSSGMPLRRFAPYDIVGAGLWGTTFALLGFFFWRSIDRVLELAKTGSLALGTVIAVGALVVVVVQRLRDEEKRDALVARVSAHPVAGPLCRRLARPARFAWNRLTPGDLGLELTTLLAVASVGSFVCLGYAITLDAGDITPGDRRGLMWADGLRTATLDDVARALTTLGTLPVAGLVVAIACAVLARRDRIADAVALVAGLALTVAGVHLLKAIENRPRPSDPVIATHGSSFPSGHSAYSITWIAATVALLPFLPSGRARVVALTASIVLATAIGLTRIFLRAHYFSDVAGGWGLGATMYAVCGMVAVVVVFMRQNHQTAT